MRNLVLYGFMGCGKSSVGAILACETGRECVDIDAQIERRAGASIPQIFARQGEGAFRTLESDTCRELSKQKGLIICCGGGTVLNPESAKFLSQNGVMILLDAPFSCCYQRIKSSDRPLVTGNTPLQLEKIFQNRLPVYK